MASASPAGHSGKRFPDCLVAVCQGGDSEGGHSGWGMGLELLKSWTGDARAPVHPNSWPSSSKGLLPCKWGTPTLGDQEAVSDMARIHTPPSSPGCGPYLEGEFKFDQEREVDSLQDALLI